MVFVDLEAEPVLKTLLRLILSCLLYCWPALLLIGFIQIYSEKGAWKGFFEDSAVDAGLLIAIWMARENVFSKSDFVKRNIILVERKLKPSQFVPALRILATLLIFVGLAPLALRFMMVQSSHGRWLSWLLIYGSSMVLAVRAIPVARIMVSQSHRISTVVLILGLSMGYIIFVNPIDFAVLVAGVFLGFWQAFWWNRSSAAYCRSRIFTLDWIVLSMGWIACRYYFGWVADIWPFGKDKPLPYLSLLTVALIWGLLAPLLLPFFKGRVDASVSDEKNSHPIFRMFIHGLVIVIMFAEAFRLDRLDPRTFFHHWSVYVSPIQQLHHGGLLLWDVPSQYGFLNILLLSCIPFSSAWVSLYWGNAILVALQATLLYFLIQKALEGFSGQIIAAALVFIATFLMSGSSIDLAGSLSWPSTNALRFVCVYVTIAYLGFWKIHRRGSKATAWLEAFLYAFSSFWSIESCFYCSFAWLAYYVASQDRMTSKENSRQVRYEIAVKIGLSIAIFAAISLFYQAHYGRFPDWWMFVEYASSFGGGFTATPMLFPGPSLLFVHGALLLLLTHFLYRRNNGRQKVFMFACFGSFWAMSTYFLVRSYPNNAMSLLLAILLLISGICLSWSPGSRQRKRALLWGSPIIVACLMSPVFHWGLTGKYLRSIKHLQFMNIRSKILPLSVNAQKITEGLSSEDPLISLQNRDLIKLKEGRAFENPWLPIVPASSMRPLSPKRAMVYLHRRLNRRRECGWILYEDPDPKVPDDQWNNDDFSQFKPSFVAWANNALAECGWRPTERWRLGNAELVKWCNEEVSQ